MNDILKYKLLNVPLVVWGLQLLYVALALGIFMVVLNGRKPSLAIQLAYVLAMIVINVAWRVAISRHGIR